MPARASRNVPDRTSPELDDDIGNRRSPGSGERDQQPGNGRSTDGDFVEQECRFSSEDRAKGDASCYGDGQPWP